MLRKTDQFEVRSGDNQIFTIQEVRQVLINIFGGKKTENLGGFEWRVAGDNGRSVSATSNDDEFIILPDDLRVWRTR